MTTEPTAPMGAYGTCQMVGCDRPATHRAGWQREDQEGLYCGKDAQAGDWSQPLTPPGLPDPVPVQPPYSAATAWSAEGARVGIVTCLRCGAAVFLSMVADSLALHDAWHRTSANDDSGASGEADR